MATKEQHDIYRAVYDEELARCGDLRASGRIYLTICSFFLGGLGFKLGDVFASGGPPVKALYLGAVVAFGLAFMSILLALGAYRYEALFRPLGELENLGDEEPSNSDFYDRRIVDIAKACDVNFRANNRRGRWLQLSTGCIMIGIMLAIASLAIAGAQTVPLTEIPNVR